MESESSAAARPTSSARILIVDDQKSARQKLSLAVEALGHRSVQCDQGGRALDLLRTHTFDLILLDIQMPGIDGFGVLDHIRRDSTLRDIPVVVVSGIDHASAAVIRSIQLGAEDFLPKSCKVEVLRARINASLRKKFNRDKERATTGQINRLTDAAALLEQSLVTRDRLNVEDLEQRQDGIGQLARVFVRMASEIHARESLLQRRIAMLRGVGLLLAAGIVCGLNVPLSKISIELSSHPIGLSIWVNYMAAIVCLAVAFLRGTLPDWNPDIIRFVLIWAVLGVVLIDVLLFWVAGHLPASTVSIIVVLEGFMVFMFSALTGQERASAKRFSGVLVGLCAVWVIIQGFNDPASSGSALWVLIAVTVPMAYTAEDILLASKLPAGLNMTAAMGLTSLTGTLLLLPMAYFANDFVPLEDMTSGLVLTLMVMGTATAVGTVLLMKLLTTAGAVFGSQTAYVITFAGVAWAVLLLGETLTTASWIALGLMVVGLLLVEPRREPDDVLSVGVFDRAAS